VLRALDALDALDASVRQCAATVGLSQSRLTHLMVEELGAPPRRWRTWLRLRRAVSATLSSGANLTRAAHEAGFTDSAHLTRACKQLTGVLPSQMLPRGDR
jgi:AraC-like DNA-binding protein